MKTNALAEYENRLLTTWEEVFKKGQLTFWILLGLKKTASHMAEIKAFISDATNQTMQADDQSMYRALRRLKQMELVDYQEESSEKNGPDRKVYFLTDIGSRVLKNFINRNIAGVFFRPDVKKLIEKT